MKEIRETATQPVEMSARDQRQREALKNAIQSDIGTFKLTPGEKEKTDSEKSPDAGLDKCNEDKRPKDIREEIQKDINNFTIPADFKADTENVLGKSDVSSETRENLCTFEQSNWDGLSQGEKERAVEKLRDSIAEDLQLENKPDVAYYNSEDPGDYGGYAESTNTIYINRFNMDDAAETASTIAHESRHCWQHERADNPQTEQDYLFKENFDDYVRPEDDYRAYKNQLVENDASSYAETVTDLIPENTPRTVAHNEISNETSFKPDNESARGPPENVDVDSKVLSVNELPEDFENKRDDYSTKIDDKVEVVEKRDLPNSLAETFKDGEYRTVVTTEPVTVYRVYGGEAKPGGTFATTEPAVSKEQVKKDSALVDSWGNTKDYEAKIVIPAGTELNIGRVAPQVNDDGKILPGDKDQIALPRGWDPSWVKSVRELD